MCTKRYKAIVQKVHISAQRYKNQLKENAQSSAENIHKKEKDNWRKKSENAQRMCQKIHHMFTKGG